MEEGYLQHGSGSGPFLTESVSVRHCGMLDHWEAFYEGKWRKIQIRKNRTFINYRGEKITIQVDGI